MAERIYIRGEGGKLEPLEEERFSTENELQALLAEHPELLDGEQMRPGDPRRWILITREKAIGGWALDHLIVDQDARPTLVEVKRGSNPELRRTVVGQLLEYAAHASEDWKADDLRRTFEGSEARPDEALDRLLQSGGEPDADSFWESVATNLAAKRLRLLFVADEIPDPLARVVEFLNEQMPNIEVLAVEIKQFRSQSTQTLVPRVLGRVASASPRRDPNTVPRLIAAGTLKDGTRLDFRVDALPLKARESVRKWIEKDPKRGHATWHNDRRKPLRWAADDEAYSPSGLAKKILRDAAKQEAEIAGPGAWLDQDGKSLAELATGLP